MDTITDCRFMRILLNGDKRDYDSHKLLDAFEEFQVLISELTDSSISYPDKYRQFKRAYRLVERGVEVEVVKELLGHTTTSTTRIYVDMALKRKLLEDNTSDVIAEMVAGEPKKHKVQSEV